MKNVLMNGEARNKLIQGVNLAANVAAVTYGPNGHTVISGNHITKDGMTAVSWIQDDDPYVMMGVNLIKDVSKRTAEVAGDGTTTATLLSALIVNNFKSCNIPTLKEITKDCNMKDFCMGCFTGKYPIEVPKEIKKDRFEEKITK